MGDGEDDDLFFPQHVGDIRLAKTRREIHTARGLVAEVVVERGGEDDFAMSPVCSSNA